MSAPQRVSNDDLMALLHELDTRADEMRAELQSLDLRLTTLERYADARDLGSTP